MAYCLIGLLSTLWSGGGGQVVVLVAPSFVESLAAAAGLAVGRLAEVAVVRLTGRHVQTKSFDEGQTLEEGNIQLQVSLVDIVVANGGTARQIGSKVCLLHRARPVETTHLPLLQPGRKTHLAARKVHDFTAKVGMGASHGRAVSCGTDVVDVPRDIADKARASVERMIAIGTPSRTKE